MREYSYFYAPKEVTGLTSSQENVDLVKGTIYFGIRAQDLLLKNNAFYKKCGFLILSEIDGLTGDDEEPVTSLIISNTNDAQRIAVIEELSFKIVPVNPDQTLNPYNLGYNTGLPYSTSISRAQITIELRTVRFTFTINDTSYVYKVEPSTIKEKRQKKSAPTFG